MKKNVLLIGEEGQTKKGAQAIREAMTTNGETQERPFLEKTPCVSNALKMENLEGPWLSITLTPIEVPLNFSGIKVTGKVYVKPVTTRKQHGANDGQP